MILVFGCSVVPPECRVVDKLIDEKGQVWVPIEELEVAEKNGFWKGYEKCDNEHEESEPTYMRGIG